VRYEPKDRETKEDLEKMESYTMKWRRRIRRVTQVQKRNACGMFYTNPYLIFLSLFNDTITKIKYCQMIRWLVNELQMGKDLVGRGHGLVYGTV
jgi:hypothetical protein